MKKISKVATGIPLRNTSPAAIEDFLVQKVRSDLGELTDIVKIRPMLRIDSEDGDLSGNITNGFGTVMISVKEKTFHLPFMISDKELLPFDSIKMGQEEVAYDMGKLRQLVIALDNHEPKGMGSEEDVMEVVDIKDIPTHNGFLGTIMSVRDNHKSQDVNGHEDYNGGTFGDMDERRMIKRASADVDVAESFEEFHEKLASVRFYTQEDVDQVVSGIQKKAETESQKMIDSISDISVDTKESEGVKREMAKLDSTNLVDAKRSASGNNVRFPMYDDNRFEFRNGRVYHNIKPLGHNAKSPAIQRIVIDSKGEYAFLRSGEKFMLDTQAPEVEFDLPQESGRGMSVGNMYALEMDKSTISVPFTVERSFREHYQDNGMLVSVRERMKEGANDPVNPMANTIFRDVLTCEPVLGNNYSEISILILKDSDQPFKEMDRYKELNDFVAEHATNPTDSSNARYMANYSSSSSVYTMGENAKAFKMSRKISGFFTRPDGVFKEGPLFHKEAAYDQSNKARLVINEQVKPAKFSVEWSFAEDADVEGQSAQKLQKREMKDLAPAQAKKVLQDLGYDARKQEMFFEIAKRNGRYAEFRLPDAKKASSVAPQDAGASKAKKAFNGIANSTLNAKNFVPVMQGMASDGIAGAVKQTTDRFSKQAETSYEVAVEFEKVAEKIRGKEWSEVAYLLNMKHHMDKLATQISEGFVKDAEPVFEEVAGLKGVIEKKASLLLDFNRQQLLRSTSPLVEPMLIKQALQQFDELSGYIHAKDVMEKEASFFHKGVREAAETAATATKRLDQSKEELAAKLRDLVIDLRTLEQKGMQGSPDYTRAQDEAKDIQKQIQTLANQAGGINSQIAGMTEDASNKMRLTGAVVGIPGIAAASYGYQGFKDER